ncbi:MAG: serine/threonine-protein phosphatase [Anaerolineales bacterium]|nr:serine/threonine-protein phosphatase [Anaerolineales bacterium]
MIKLEAASLLDVGLFRDMNEDSVLAQVIHALNRPALGLFVVCDGMGGHMGGEFASYWAVEAIKSEFASLFESRDPRATVILREEEMDAAKMAAISQTADAGQKIDLEELVRSAIQKANNVVFEYARNKPEKAGNAGTTVTMAVVLGDQVVIANAGDSRTYLLRDHELHQITRDHSLVAHLVAEGELMPDEIYTHPQRNVIYRFLGQKGLVQPDMFYETLHEGDYLLLCSDGLWEMVRSDSRIVELIESAKEPLDACKALVKAANDGGGDDNIGVVLVRIS